MLSGIGLPLMFAVGRGWTEMEYFWFMLVSLVLYVPVMSCFNMPWVSLGSEMTPDYHERTRLMATKMAIQKIPELAMFGAAQFTTLAWFHDANGKPDVLHGAQVYTTILGAVMIILSILIFSMTRERYYDRVVASSAERVPFKDTLYRTLKNRGFRRVLGMMLAYMMATAMVGTLGYYATVYYVCKGRCGDGRQVEHADGHLGHGVWPRGHPVLGVALQARRQAQCTAGDPGARHRRLHRRLVLLQPQHPVAAALCQRLRGLHGRRLLDHLRLDAGRRDRERRARHRPAPRGLVLGLRVLDLRAGLALGNLGSGWVLQFTGFTPTCPPRATRPSS